MVSIDLLKRQSEGKYTFKMCHHTVLHENLFGYIIKCNVCQEIKICLGNVVSHVEVDGFYAMKRVLEQAARKKSDHSETQLMIKTKLDHMWICFTPSEMRYALELFGIANIMLQTEQVLWTN